MQFCQSYERLESLSYSLEASNLFENDHYSSGLHLLKIMLQLTQTCFLDYFFRQQAKIRPAYERRKGQDN